MEQNAWLNFSDYSRPVRYSTFVQPSSLSCPWASEGGPGPPGFWNLTFYITFLAKKVVFLGFEKEKWNFIKFVPPGKIVLLEKSANGTPHKISFRRPCCCCFLWVRYGVRTRPACTVAKAAVIQRTKILTVCNTARVKLGCSLTSTVCSNLGPFLSTA